MKIYSISDYSIHETTQSIWDGWVASGNSKAQRFAPLPDPPEFEATTHTCEWGQGEWVVSQIPPPTRRVWQTAADFWESFTLPEQVAVSASDIPAVRALVVSLSVWQAEMWSDDPRVQAGFHALIQSGLLTSSRANEILHPPGLQP
jgi:hypothetical protein